MENFDTNLLGDYNNTYPIEWPEYYPHWIWRTQFSAQEDSSPPIKRLACKRLSLY